MEGAEEAGVFSDPETSPVELQPLNPVRELQCKEEEDDEEEDEEEDGDAEIFSAWMSQYRAGTPGERKAEDQEQRGENKSKEFPEVVLHVPGRRDRRSSLPCPVTLTAMQFNRLHSATQAPVTAKVLLQRSSSRGLLLPASSSSPRPERRSSIISTIPEVAQTKRSHFRRRNVMSMSDADSVCLICHSDLCKEGIKELQCSHTFHKQCIEEWLWWKPSCPTCQVHVSVPQLWDSSRTPDP